MPKVFIYNGDGVSKESVSDLSELFAQHNIVDRADIVVSNLSQNLSGLDPRKDPCTLVIPGGSSIYMTWAFPEETKKTFAQMNASGFNYLGICAGAYLGTATADTYWHIPQKVSSRAQSSNNLETNFQAPKFVTSMEIEFKETCLHYSKAFKAVGPIIPNDHSYKYIPQKELDLKNVFPFKAEITFSDNKSLPQLFVGGCGFAAVSQDSQDVVAHYSQQSAYEFDQTDVDSKQQPQIIRYESLPAIISHRATPESDRGNVILSGTHIEACLKNSKMLSFFKPTNKNLFAFSLSEEDFLSLEESAGAAAEVVVPLLKEAFNRK